MEISPRLCRSVFDKSDILYYYKYNMFECCQTNTKNVSVDSVMEINVIRRPKYGFILDRDYNHRWP